VTATDVALSSCSSTRQFVLSSARIRGGIPMRPCMQDTSPCVPDRPAMPAYTWMGRRRVLDSSAKSFPAVEAATAARLKVGNCNTINSVSLLIARARCSSSVYVRAVIGRIPGGATTQRRDTWSRTVIEEKSCGGSLYRSAHQRLQLPVAPGRGAPWYNSPSRSVRGASVSGMRWPYTR
jgi:hypothetical protein